VRERGERREERERERERERENKRMSPHLSTDLCLFGNHALGPFCNSLTILLFHTHTHTHTHFPTFLLFTR